MTCKDCIHYEMCLKKCGKSKAFAEMVDEKYFSHADECDFFKDKSRYIEVPEKVYQTDGVRVYEIEVKGIIFDSDAVAFDARAIGQSVFLTREEAEERIEQ